MVVSPMQSKNMFSHFGQIEACLYFGRDAGAAEVVLLLMGVRGHETSCFGAKEILPPLVVG